MKFCNFTRLCEVMQRFSVVRLLVLEFRSIIPINDPFFEDVSVVLSEL